MRFGTGSRRGFGRAAARLARRRNARNRRMHQARAALNSKRMPTPPKRDTSEAALKKAMAKRYKQSLANKANAAARDGKIPKRARLKKSDLNVLQKARQKTPTPKSSRPNNAKGVTQGGIPARAPTQASAAQQAKQIQPKRQFNDPTMYSEGGSVSRTGHTDYRKKGMFK